MLKHIVRCMQFGKGADCAPVAMLVNEALNVHKVKAHLLFSYLWESFDVSVDVTFK